MVPMSHDGQKSPHLCGEWATTNRERFNESHKCPSPESFFSNSKRRFIIPGLDLTPTYLSSPEYVCWVATNSNVSNEEPEVSLSPYLCVVVTVKTDARVWRQPQSLHDLYFISRLSHIRWSITKAKLTGQSLSILSFADGRCSW